MRKNYLKELNVKSGQEVLDEINKKRKMEKAALKIY